jgi:hypothetical protein
VPHRIYKINKNERKRADLVVRELLKRKLYRGSYLDTYTGWTESTLKNYRGGWASFISFLEEEELVWEDFNSPEGIQRIFDDFAAC